MPEPRKERPLRRLPRLRQGRRKTPDPRGPEESQGCRPQTGAAGRNSERSADQPTHPGGLAVQRQGHQPHRLKDTPSDQHLSNADHPHPAPQKHRDRRGKDRDRVQEPKRNVDQGHLPALDRLLQSEHHHAHRSGLRHWYRQRRRHREVPASLGLREL